MGPRATKRAQGWLELDRIRNLVQYMIMIRLNIHEAKTHLSRYLAQLQEGERILICRRNVPIAEIRPISRPRQQKRPFGILKGQMSVPETFFESLPDELLDVFEGR